MRGLVLTGLILTLSGCIGPGSRPSDLDNLCEMFSQREDWYEDALEAQERWGTPIQVPMSIIYQESSFRHDARPPMRYFLFIPYGRASTAYGYPQAKDETWDEYISETGNWGADRDDFGDAIDFIAWYVNKTQRINGVSKWDAYNQYLAYHEGRGGFSRGSHQGKTWLINTARVVDERAKRYSAQYRSCKDDLDSGWF
ncbi:MAG: hypothetical protein HWD83_05230 [Gammaproteobacteria bacterium]|nr:hypothetical protein [Gammaproteobacteria bacterium]